MKRSGWSRPSPALVIACLALFVALGGTVLAATKIDGRAIRVKSLPGNRLQPASVPGNRLRKGTIPGNRIAPGSLKGSRIDVGTLRQVPNAAHADFADTARRAQTAIAADHAADATTINGHAVGCAQGRREWAGACWDVKPSEAAVTLDEAVAACAAAGGELPNVIPLVAFAREPGIQSSSTGEWTKSENLITVNSYSLAVVEKGTFSHFERPTASEHFRCVTPFLD
jgi:hypothetical protein